MTKKIINDPVHGFINIQDDLLFSIIEHPYFQRLRRIKQLGLTNLVYPGALHNRFNHALGAMHLMGEAIRDLRLKGQIISEEEEQAALIAILLHDIGHGPFSHALESSIVSEVSHETLSLLFMEKLNTEFDGKLTMAIDIFKGEYAKKFLHQLVSSQLDVDRMDYLQRDSYFTGVSEGVIGTQRIIKMMNVVNDQLVIEAKGIYSIENFLTSRRIMYWQVYLHKTVLSAEFLLIKILQRAKFLSKKGVALFASNSLNYFLEHQIGMSDFAKNDESLKRFASLDDLDILSAVKMWCEHNDNVLSSLSKKLINRQLFKVDLKPEEFDEAYVLKLQQLYALQTGMSVEDAAYFVFTGKASTYTYNPEQDKINILLKSGELMDISLASDQLNVEALSKGVKKYFMCFPKEIAKLI